MPAIQYKIRQIASVKKQPIFGVTIPSDIAEKFKGTKFFIEVSTKEITFRSGLDLSEQGEKRDKEVDKWLKKDII